MRVYLLLGLAANLWAGKLARRAEGYSELFRRRSRFDFFYRSFCTDFLVFESILSASALFGADTGGDFRPVLMDYVDLARRNCYEVEYGGGRLPMFSYYPKTDNLVPPGSPIHKLFFSKDDNVPDNDTNAIIWGSIHALLAGLGESEADRAYRLECAALPALLRDHIQGTGKYGRGRLCYENGAKASDRGVFTWVFDGHNEIDPTSNVNILNYLAVLSRGLPAAGVDEAPSLSVPILAFLADHALDGSLLDPRFQQYYPWGAVFFFWNRFLGNYSALDAEAARRFDPHGAIAIIDRHMRNAAEAGLRDPCGTNPFDRVLCAAYARSRGVLPGWLDGELRQDGFVAHFDENHYEIFHLLYPCTIACFPARLGHAAYLDFLREDERADGAGFWEAGA